MMLCKWEKLPEEMRTEAVRPYYDALKKRQVSLFLKRAFDVVVSACMLLLLLPVFLVLAIAIKLDSPGPVFYRQVRLTRNGREFKILYASVTYFRLKVGDQVTVIIPADNEDATWAAVEAGL